MNKISPKLLLLTELTILLLFFSFSAVVCTQLFLKSYETSEKAKLLDMSVTEATSVAETLKSTSGSLEKAGSIISEGENFELSENSLTIYYDDNMNPKPKNSSSCFALIEKKSLASYISYTITFKDISHSKIIYELKFKNIPKENINDEI